jgi:hypothetical protein
MVMFGVLVTGLAIYAGIVGLPQPSVVSVAIIHPTQTPTNLANTAGRTQPTPTYTRTITPQPQATPTLAPAQPRTFFDGDLDECNNLTGLPYEVIGVIETNNVSVNVRTGPGTNYGRNGVINDEVRVCLRGRNSASTWVMINWNKWVRTDLIWFSDRQRERIENLPITE